MNSYDEERLEYKLFKNSLIILEIQIFRYG